MGKFFLKKFKPTRFFMVINVVPMITCVVSHLIRIKK